MTTPSSSSQVPMDETDKNVQGRPSMTPSTGRPRVPSLGDRLAALPPEAATGSRDYGRGYATAVRDVLALLWAHDGNHLLLDSCGCGPEIVAAQAARTPVPSFAGTQEDA